MNKKQVSYSTFCVKPHEFYFYNRMKRPSFHRCYCYVVERRTAGLGDQREPSESAAVAVGAVPPAAGTVPGAGRLPHPLLRV